MNELYLPQGAKFLDKAFDVTVDFGSNFDGIVFWLFPDKDRSKQHCFSYPSHLSEPVEEEGLGITLVQECILCHQLQNSSYDM